MRRWGKLAVFVAFGPGCAAASRSPSSGPSSVAPLASRDDPVRSELESRFSPKPRPGELAPRRGVLPQPPANGNPVPMTLTVVVRNRCTTPVRLAVSTSPDAALPSRPEPATLQPGEAVVAGVRADGYLRLADAPNTRGVSVYGGGTMTVAGAQCDEIGVVDWTWP